jgi:hypothetical protein
MIRGRKPALVSRHRDHMIISRENLGVVLRSADSAGAYVHGRLTALPLSRTTRHPGIPGASSAALLSHHSVRLSILVLDDLYNFA